MQPCVATMDYGACTSADARLSMAGWPSAHLHVSAQCQACVSGRLIPSRLRSSLSYFYERSYAVVTCPYDITSYAICIYYFFLHHKASCNFFYPYVLR